METEQDGNGMDLGTVDEQDSLGLYGEGQNENLMSELEPEKIVSNECPNIIQKTMVDENLDLNTEINNDLDRPDELEGNFPLMKVNKERENEDRPDELEGNLSPISSVNTGDFDTVLNSDDDDDSKETRDDERGEQRESKNQNFKSDSDSDNKSQSDESDSDKDRESSDSEVSSDEDSNDSGEEKSEGRSLKCRKKVN